MDCEVKYNIVVLGTGGVGKSCKFVSPHNNGCQQYMHRSYDCIITHSSHHSVCKTNIL